MQKNLKLLGVIAILGASLAISGFAIQDAMAAGGANKTVYSTNEPVLISGSEGGKILAMAEMKTSQPQDVLVLYTEECSLYTEVNLKSHKSKTGTAGEERDEVSASHTVQLYVDDYAIGEPITMCDRTFGIETNILNQIQDLCVAVVDEDGNTFTGNAFECEETFLDIWIDTKSAHGWNWVVLNLGQDPDFYEGNMHTFEIYGAYNTEGNTESDPKKAGAVTVQRSLIVIPTQLNVGAE